MTSYTASTQHATNAIRYEAVDDDAVVEVKLNNTVQNSSTLTWAAGENTVTVKVTSHGVSKTYTIAVTKT